MASTKVLSLQKVPVETKPLFVPPLEDIVSAFRKELPKNFLSVSVDVVECPDLTKAPFNLAAKGFGGDPSILDIGGPPYLLPLVNRDKVYDLKDIPAITGTNPSFIVGAGAGPWPYTGTNCELVVNIGITDEEVKNLIRIAKISETAAAKQVLEIPPQSETKFCLLANLLCCRGKETKVVKVHCKTRIGEKDFVTSMRLALVENFGNQPVGMGGVFLLANGRAKHHVMPDFSTTPITSDEGVNQWLQFYDLAAPMVEVGTFVSHDPGLDLRVQHFHGYGNTEGGHYHYDTTPDTVEYVAYLVPASTIYRVDKPQDSLGIGKD